MLAHLEQSVSGGVVPARALTTGPKLSPLQVALWDRLLAYGAALGVASAASRPLPLGVESDTRVWAAAGVG